jgi:hypothetical protein
MDLLLRFPPLTLSARRGNKQWQEMALKILLIGRKIVERERPTRKRVGFAPPLARASGFDWRVIAALDATLH